VEAGWEISHRELVVGETAIIFWHRTDRQESRRFRMFS
jgi:hypothetical protein